jgi:hypothetical protein
VKIKIDGVQVDVLDARCPARECYRFMYDGRAVPGSWTCSACEGRTDDPPVVG